MVNKRVARWHEGFTYYPSCSNWYEVLKYMDNHRGEMPDCEAFRYLMEGDEELIKGKGYIAQEDFDFDDEELSQIPPTLREALGLDEERKR